MMTASATHVDSPRTRDAQAALHKMATSTERVGDENVPAARNGASSSSGSKAAKHGSKDELKKPTASESDENEEEEDAEEEEDDDESKARASTTKEGEDAKDKSEGEKTSKKSRRELPPHTVAILKGWMLSPEHVKHPYPTDEDKQMLLKKTGINMKQLTNWFTNARKRIWKPMMRREHSRQLQSAMEYEKARVPYPGAPPMGYREGAAPYPPRPAIRHSFDAGSLGAPIRAEPVGYHHGYEAPPPGYPVPPTHAYPPRTIRSVSESATGHEMDDYIDAMRIRKRVHEMSPDAVDGEGMAHADKRYRRGSVMSPRCLKILQDWVAAHAHMEYPLPADSDKLQLSRDTGLDVQQIELWFKTNVGRYGAPLQPPPAQAPQPAPSAMPHGHPAYRSIPSRDNSMYPPPPAYGERRSIPSQGNPMFPPRPTPATRSSIPGPGNSQFPPPPAVRRDGSGGYRPDMTSPGYPYPQQQQQQQHPGYEGEGGRPMRTMSINSAQYAHQGGSVAPSPAIPTPVGAPGSTGLPSLTGRPAVPGARPGPPMGQARDSRSHTLDMGQFADARRRKMNFQDILASTSAPQIPSQLPRAQPGSGYDASRPPSADNMYPSEVTAPYAQKMYEQPRSGGMTVAAPLPGSASAAPEAQVPGRI